MLTCGDDQRGLQLVLIRFAARSNTSLLSVPLSLSAERTPSSAMATDSRRRMPPENRPVRVLAAAVSPTWASSDSACSFTASEPMPCTRQSHASALRPVLAVMSI